MQVRLLVIEEYAIVREALVGLLSADQELEVVDQARNVAEATEKVQSLKPDVVIIGADLPDGGGLEAIQLVKEIVPEAKILLLSSSTDGEDVVAAIRAGARGYIARDAHASTLIELTKRVVSGGVGLTEETMSQLISGLARQDWNNVSEPSSDRSAILTKQEQRILSLICQGASNKTIAWTLNVSENTVRAHLRSLMLKMDAENRTQLAIMAIRRGLGGENDTDLNASA